MATTGRPSKLTPELQQRLVQLIKAGCYPEVAAGACGINRRTFYEWMQRAEGVHPTRSSTKALRAFAHAIAEAVDTSEARLVVKLAEYIEGTRAGKRKPRIRSRISTGQVIAMQWQLSRRFPDRWGQRPAMPAVSVSAHAGDEEEGTGVSIQVVVASEAAESDTGSDA